MEILNSLVNSNCFGILQEKLNVWKYEFERNFTESNLSRCCELIEFSARIQAQLFKLLGVCGLYTGLAESETNLKNKLILYLGKDYLENGLTAGIVMSILNKIKQPKRPKSFRKTSVKKLDHSKNTVGNSFSNCNISEICGNSEHYSKTLSQGIYDKLDDLKKSIIDLSNDSHLSSSERIRRKKKSSRHNSDSYFKESENRNESILSDAFGYSSTTQDIGFFDAEETRNDSYLQTLVGRYNDLFSESRVKAMNYLQLHNDDHENNQRIIFALIMVIEKSVAKCQRAYRSYNNGKLIQSFYEPIPHSTLKNLRTQIIYKIVNKQSKCYRFHIPDYFSFVDLKDFINRAIQLFWNFGAMKNRLHLLEATDGDIFDQYKYRRSYDSDPQGHLINHHIWPCLVQSGRILVKGEACTKTKIDKNQSKTCSINSSVYGRFLTKY